MIAQGVGNGASAQYGTIRHPLHCDRFPGLPAKGISADSALSIRVGELMPRDDCVNGNQDHWTVSRLPFIRIHPIHPRWDNGFLSPARTLISIASRLLRAFYKW